MITRGWAKSPRNFGALTHPAFGLARPLHGCRKSLRKKSREGSSIGRTLLEGMLGGAAKLTEPRVRPAPSRPSRESLYGFGWGAVNGLQQGRWAGENSMN